MSLFTKATAVADLRANRLVILSQRYFQGQTLSDDFIFDKVISAEATLSRRLRVPLEPVEVLPVPTQAEIDALNGARWEEEPGYDYSPQMFQGDTFGFIQLRRRPVIQLHSVTFVYPAPNLTWEIPAAWLRVDKRYGQVRIVPAVGSVGMPVAAFVGQVLGGRGIPHMIHVRYRAGLESTADTYPDVVDLIKKMAALSLVEDSFTPASVSQSVDGMTQSMSQDMDKLGATIEAKIEALRQYFHGVRMTVL